MGLNAFDPSGIKLPFTHIHTGGLCFLIQISRPWAFPINISNHANLHN